MFQRLQVLRVSLPFRAPDTFVGRFVKPPIADHTPVLVTGGLGDLIVSLGAVEALHRKVGDVILYTRHTEAAKLFTDLPVKDSAGIIKNGFDFFIRMNAIARFEMAANFKTFKNPKTEEVFIDNQHFLATEDWGDLTRKHPHLDCYIADKAVKQGLNRETITYAYLNLPYRRPALRLWLEQKNKIITVHDGYDAYNKIESRRSTKNWDMQHWKDFVEEIKRRFPEHKVVQLGGKESRSIKGVDYNFCGMLSFAESCVYLNQSALHVDGDSGLVHTARAMGKKSLVLFGPTNADFFGYKENVNLKPNYCGGCWWLQEDWMSKCVMGHGSPECMDSHDPMVVASVAEKILKIEEREIHEREQRELEQACERLRRQITRGRGDGPDKGQDPVTAGQ